MIVIACPGQGSQKPGFMSVWLEIDSYRQDIEMMSEAIGLDLVKHGTVSDEETIRDTQIAQPLIVAASIASANLLNLDKAAGVAGHSVGEVAAGYVAGILNQTDAINLVNLRGQAMARAAKLSSGTAMAAVLGGEESEVLAKLAEYDLTPANYNGAGQIVAAGLKSSIDKLIQNPPAMAKVIPLSVAGAFHTKYMEPAVAELTEFTNSITPSDPKKIIWSNQSGQRINSGVEYLDLLVGQVANPVRWDLCMKSMNEQSVNGLIELSPAGTLAGLAKRGMQLTEIVSLKEPADIERANNLLSGEK